MKKSIITLGILAASALGAFTSCEDMMTVDSGDKAYVNANDTLYSYLGIMRAMQDIAERQVILGEIRGDLVSSTEYTTDTLYAISHFEDPQDESCSMLQVSDYYNVINNCNFYIHNCDTSAIKSNIKYMIPEYAQVKAIRAWTYLQLVKNYKEVPYITEPVKNLDVIKNFDYDKNLVNKDNLADKLIEDGILDLIDVRYPGYGTNNNYATWENGDVQISSRLCYIPIRLVLGDLYLLRGNGTADFEKAATYYYDFLKKEASPMALNYVDINNYRNGEISYMIMNGFSDWAGTYNYSATTTEVISLIPSAANAGLGKMLTRVADIFGYKPTSSQSASEVVNDDGDATGEFSVGGSINVSRNYKRQYAPSEAYNDVNYAQTAIYHAKINNVMVETPTYIPNTDTRMFMSVENYKYEGGSYPLCSKAASGGTFYYTIPTYRKTLVWLRLAEAINRAGYPEYAFAILKDGLNEQNIPTVGDRYEPIFNESGYQLLSNGDSHLWRDASGEEPVYYTEDEDGNLVVYEGTVGNKYKPLMNTIENDSVYHKSAKQAMYYVTDVDLVNKFNSFLDFSDQVWEDTYGIHARGAGFGSYVSATGNETNITGYNDSVIYDYSKLVKAQGVDIKTAPREDIIDAVENIIVDELALETAFEGNRFTDLVRIAEHKNAAGKQGTEWLAKKIANRGSHRATEKLPAVTSEDANIYSKLLNTKNWYFTLPKWEVK